MNKLLSTVLCTRCQSQLSQKNRYAECVNKNCSQKYPYKNGILNMLPKQFINDKHSKDQKKYYDIEYKRYYLGQKFEFQNRYIKRLYDFLPKQKSVVLDFASGQGYMTIAVARKGHQVVACDISMVGLEYTRFSAKKLGIEKNILLIAGDLTTISFKQKSFNFYIMTHVLEHFKNDYEIIQNLLNAAKPHARFFISVPLSLKYVLYPLIPLYIYSDKQVGHLRRYTKESIIKLFKKPMKPIMIIYTGHLIKIAGAIINLIGIHGFDIRVEDIDEKQADSKILASVITLGLEMKK